MSHEHLQLNKLSERQEKVTVSIAKLIMDVFDTFIYNGNLYYYCDGLYHMHSTKTMLLELKNVVPKEILDKLTMREQKEIVDILFTRSRTLEELPKYKNLLNVENGIYDVVNDRLIKHSSRYIFTYKLKVRYNPRTECNKFQKVIEQSMMGDYSWKMHLQEYMGYAISDYPLKKEFILFFGKKDTSKSLIAGILRKIIGDEYVSALDLTHLGDERYLAHMYSKRMNICTDMSSVVLRNLSHIKQLTSVSDAYMVKGVGKQPMMVSQKPKMLFASNHYPKLISETEDLKAYFTRVHVIPFRYEVPPEEQIVDYVDILFENESEGILLWIIEGYRRFLKNDGNFTSCRAVNKAKEEYENEYVLPIKFAKERLKLIPNKKAFSKEIQDALIEFCEERNIEFKPEYMQRLRKHLTSIGIENKKIRKKDITLQGFDGVKILPSPVSWAKFTDAK